jgi:hypothetical protein
MATQRYSVTPHLHPDLIPEAMPEGENFRDFPEERKKLNDGAESSPSLRCVDERS